MSVLTQRLRLCDLTSLFIPVAEAYECPLQKASMSESKQVLSTLYFAHMSVTAHCVFTFDNKNPRYTSIHFVYAYQGELDLSPQLCVSGDTLTTLGRVMGNIHDTYMIQWQLMAPSGNTNQTGQ